LHSGFFTVDTYTFTCGYGKPRSYMTAPALSKTFNAFRWLGGGLSTLLYPSRCRMCSAELGGLEGPYFCGECGAEIAPESVMGDAEDYRISPAYLPAGVAAYACFPYGGTAGSAVKLLKYDGKTALARVMGDAVGELISLLNGDFDNVVSVPLHSHRRRERGFDQSGLITRRAAENAKVRTAQNGALRRVRDTVPQVKLDGPARLDNITGAFAADERFFAGRRVLLVDDVITTGATVRACAKAIEDAGGAVAAAVAFAAPRN
jgi:ComF family protein